jgi:hypothetical protein
MMTKIVFAVDKPHVVYAVNEGAEPNDEFTAGEWCT